ncbi:hypothetical protein FD755_022228 [Muntiacus reevesi]|uniref:Uncharacterized protein n=1 Tax=Muntiacus reevesi TaxID=9886 RepID=A0A5N3VZP5_MUNRE|nr:hypothetical protein FD755_022228 [Muntiacus reevesi]
MTTSPLQAGGGGRVGKSALTIQLFQKIFVPDYKPTIQDSSLKHTKIDSQWAILDYMRTGDGFPIVSSVTDKTTFEHVDCFHQLILRVDLMHLRKVTREQGKEMATKHNIPYIETGAKDPPLNVDDAFHDLVRKKKKKTKRWGDQVTGSHKRQCVIL